MDRAHRRGLHRHYGPCAPRRYLPLWTAHVRDDGPLGDRPTLAAQSELRADFANVWQMADKIVYSTTLHAVSTANTRLERRLDPDAVREVKTSADSDLTVGGPTLAAHAFSAGLIDECHIFVCPVLVGGGKPAFPSDARVQLELRRTSGWLTW